MNDISSDGSALTITRPTKSMNLKRRCIGKFLSMICNGQKPLLDTLNKVTPSVLITYVIVLQHLFNVRSYKKLLCISLITSELAIIVSFSAMRKNILRSLRSQIMFLLDILN